MQIKKSPRVYDVVVIGSGASGGMAAWNLTRQGINVLVLDAGEKFDRSTFWTHVMPYEARERAARGEQPPPAPRCGEVRLKEDRVRLRRERDENGAGDVRHL
ncbi:MAG TPA: FAD-dependent oxidoreductase [Blastocatellia bacterium]|nr:FAD-dependent oxidoreductase [Blastocatellia bacterium]